MPCIPLKVMPGGRMKIKVFGDRNWKDAQHLNRIRYVSASRVKWFEIPAGSESLMRRREGVDNGR